MTGTVKDLFAFALNLYRAPLRYRPFIQKRNSVPPGFADFLDVLSKREGHEVWIEYKGIQGATSQELREAGVFLVKRILFVDDADHYRLFGLESTATIQEIRERYRLLIGLFHPDRRSFGDDWNELYAPKINDAYNILKNPEKRRGYDEDVGLYTPATPREVGSETLYWGDAGKQREVAQDSTRGSAIRSLSQANPFYADFREDSGMDSAKPSDQTSADMAEAPVGILRPRIKWKNPPRESMPEFQEARIRQADIDYLLFRFVQSYQAGAIEDFVSLFDHNALTDDGLGRGYIESLYGNLFDNFSVRSMKIKDVFWAPEKNRLAKIAFLVEVWVESSPFQDARKYGGDADMQVELGDTGLLITKFHHRVSPK